MTSTPRRAVPPAVAKTVVRLLVWAAVAALAWYLVRALRRVDWAAVGDAVSHLAWWQVLVLLLLVVARAALSSTPLALFTEGLGLRRAVGNDLVLLRSGRLSDRIGRKPFVIAGLLICGLSTMTMGLTDDLVIFYIATAISGVGSGIMGPAQQAAVADVVGSGRRGGPLLAAFQITSDIGGFAGPLVAGTVAEKLSFEAAWAVTGGIMLLPIVLWVLVPKGFGPGGSADSDPDERADDVRGTDGDRAEQQLPDGPTDLGLGGEVRGEPAREQ